MKKLLLLLTMTLGGCMTYPQAEVVAHDLAAAFYPGTSIRTTAVGNVGPGEALVAVTVGTRPPILLSCKDWHCRVAETQLPAAATEPSVDKETK